jgi:hypothetical protein
MATIRGNREIRLRYRWFIVAALAILFAGSISGERSVRADESYDPEELKFLKIINKYREDHHLPPCSSRMPSPRPPGTTPRTWAITTFSPTTA